MLMNQMHTLPTYLAPVCGPVLRHVPRAGGVGGHQALSNMISYGKGARILKERPLSI